MTADHTNVNERLYAELRRLAARYMGNERPDHTLQPTALVHEAFVRLADADLDVESRSHFLATAARTMRRILVDHARRTNAEKRGGGRARVTLDLDRLADEPGPVVDLVSLNDALERLAERHPRKARVVELRYFGGLELAEIADQLDISLRTVSYDVRAACAWLALELEDDDA